ncbi:MAG: hypothetical protein Q8L78_08400 [Coxiellaceae bacterium]|nr:hypothetical protein [Coxiellaceae bacterium]
MRNYKYYEPASKLSSLITALLSALFYYLSTEDASLKEKLSGIIVNLFINYFMAKNSIDFESTLIDNKKTYQAIAYPFFAALLYTPQTIIAYRDGEADNKILAFSSAVATMLSGSTLNMNSLKGLVDFTQGDIIPHFKKASVEAWEVRKNTLRNLEILLERVRFSNYKAFELQSMIGANEKNTEALIRIAFLLAESTKKTSYLKKSLPKKLLKLAPQLTIATTMVLGSFGYNCATEAALRTYFFSDSPQTAASFALLLMSCLFILNIKAAFMLVSAIINITSSIIKYGKLPNNCHLGGTPLKLLTCCSPLIALMLTSFSGFIATNLYNKHCSSSQLHFLRFPYANDVIDYSTRVFNGTYAEIAIINAEKNHIRHSSNNENDRSFLEVMDTLQNFRDAIKIMPANLLQDSLNELGENCLRLADPFLFENLQARDLEEARLLPGMR